MPTLVDELLQHAYHPRNTLDQMLLALLEGLAERGQVVGGTVTLSRPRPVELRLPSSRSGVRTLVQTVPITYAGRALGELQFEHAPGPGGAVLRRRFEHLARRSAYLIKRQDMLAWAQLRLGRPLTLIGSCRALDRLEEFVEKAAQSCLPVVLRGEFGTEKVQLAAAVHCCGPFRDGPFVEINCADPHGDPDQWFSQARGGTLFFNGIDEMPLALQLQLPQRMRTLLGQWSLFPGDGRCRVVASTTADLGERVREGRFFRALLAELDFLDAELPPLRERGQDIEALLAVMLLRHGHDPDRLLTPELLAVCQAHAWPENLFEMERLMARLAVMTGGRPIGLADVERHAPALLGTAEARRLVLQDNAEDSVNGHVSPTSLETDAAHGTPVAPEMASRQPGPAQVDWAACLVHQELDTCPGLHGALRRALSCLANHYTGAVTLTDLARHAHVSPSHLRHLFRSSMGTSFKTLLQQMRVEKAKQLLRDGPIRITDVALAVGFGDLSHFERSFRRFAGVSPKEFRRG